MASNPPLAPAADIPVGDLKLFDNYVPGIGAGNWRISVVHSLSQGGAALNDEPLGALQEFVVVAPQVAMDPGIIVNRYPPAGSTAPYREVLPHIVLSDPMLPWERVMGDAHGSGVRTPWLALLVLSEDEIVGGKTNTNRTQSSSIHDFLAADPDVLKPAIALEADVAATDTCTFVTLPVAVFQAVAPRACELPFLAHCRQANTGDKAIAGLNEHGLFSVIIANRLPAVPAAAGAAPAKNYVHLVSLEGLRDKLAPDADFAGHSQIALLSLANWSFQSMPDSQEDFRGLAQHLVGAEAAGADALWLRLPPGGITGTDAASTEARGRLSEGFVPLPFQLRSGEASFAWYRGPLTPVLPAPLAKTGAFPTADAALVYQKRFGLFDASLAAAWEAGRAAALSDRVFAQRMLDFRRRAHAIVDRLHDRLTNDHFTAADIAEVDPDRLVQHEFLDLLTARLVSDIGAAKPSGAPAPNPPAAAAAVPGSVKDDIKQFLADPGVQAVLAPLISEDLDPVAQWLARLLLLYPVPFAYLVPHEHMLPAESLRFFYLDTNWTGALIDGAVSVGMESSRQSFFHEMMGGLVEDAAHEAAQSIRSNLLGIEPPAAQASRGMVSGFLLRSALVSGWPNLAVRPCLADGTMLKILRMDHLSSSTLLCLFWGVPDYVDIAEPQEGFRFGVDDDGGVALRNPTDSGGLPLGAQLGEPPAAPVAPVPVFDRNGADALCMRAPGSRVLNIDPAASAGLVATLCARLKEAGHPIDRLGPADLALQMVKSPEAVRFTSSAS